MIDLTGFHVLVTGGSRGIGAACCRLFARAGASVLFTYRDREDAAEAVLDELARVSSRDHRRFPCDLAERAEIRELFSYLGSEWGKLDVLVNNAGIWVHNPLGHLDEERFDETMEVNVAACFLAAREALPFLRRSAHANIVNVTSTAGQRGEAFYSPYAASKGAMISATKAWSTELAPAVRVNSVAPGWVDTDMSSPAFEGEGRAAIAAAIPLQRIATAEEIAGPILFLASPLARHITGEVLNVNGGSVLVG
ncbi:MAG: SDR family oxidoreductase [Thermoanaerobaculia bacterium]|nr:SDR family oxidoreductase [Thermoanaerobaculia bacterium]